MRVILVVGLLLPLPAAAQSVATIGVALSGIPTAPTAAVGTSTDQIATTAFVQANASPIAANVSGSTVNLPGLTPRSLSTRLADVYNVRDYGALGTGTPTALASQFTAAATASLAAFAAQSVSGATPYAWMTNPAFGLTFSIPTSTDQGGKSSVLTFLTSLSGINNWSATVAAWQDPAHGNYLLQTGMQVGGSCIAAGTTVTAIGRTQGASGYGTVTLSQSSSTDCGTGTQITFTLAPSQLQLLTMDWLGLQGAMAAAWLNVQAGGSVYIPSGNYIINHPLVNAGGVIDPNVSLPNLDIHGDGVAVTRMQYLTDLGQDSCAISEATRGAPHSSSSTYHDFRILGPYTASRVNGVSPNRMDGLCIGAGARAWDLNIEGMHAGINGIKDHWTIRDSNFANNGYGIYYAPYTSTMGNQSFTDISVAGNTIAGFGISTTDQIDSSTFKNVHTGFSPYGFYREPVLTTITNPIGFLSNSVLTNVWIEAVGNAWIYGAGQVGNVVGNVFTGGGFSDVGSQTAYSIPNGSGGTLPAPAVIYTDVFANNTMIGTNWSAYGSVSDGIVEASQSCFQNAWYDDINFVFNQTAAVPAMRCGPNPQDDRFYNPQGDGLFRRVSTNVTAGEAVSDNGGFQVVPFADGRSFAGITASPAVTNGIVGVVSFSDNTQNVVKADPNQVIASGQPVFATTGGVAGGLDGNGAVGTAWTGSGAGTATVRVDLDPGMKGGATGAATGLAAGGTTQSTATVVRSSTNQFSTVASGSGAMLGIVPVGASVTIYNDGVNVLRVFPPLGGQIGAAGVNVGVPLAAGASGTYRRIAATLWHQ